VAGKIPLSKGGVARERIRQAPRREKRIGVAIHFGDGRIKKGGDWPLRGGTRGKSLTMERKGHSFKRKIRTANLHQAKMFEILKGGGPRRKAVQKKTMVSWRKQVHGFVNSGEGKNGIWSGGQGG